MPNAEIREEWGRRIEAEYRSAAHAHVVTGWLIEVGAPPELVCDGLRIVADELLHAEMSAEVYAAAGGVARPQLDRATLVLARVEPIEPALFRAILELFCLGETVAVPLFRQMLAGASEGVARRALRQIVADEARHRRFGWDVWGWANQGSLRATAHAVAATALPEMLARVRAAYGEGIGESIDPVSRAWGLLPAREYGRILRQVERDWWIPRFYSVLPTSGAGELRTRPAASRR